MHGPKKKRNWARALPALPVPALPATPPVNTAQTTSIVISTVFRIMSLPVDILTLFGTSYKEIVVVVLVEGGQVGVNSTVVVDTSSPPQQKSSYLVSYIIIIIILNLAKNSVCYKNYPASINIAMTTTRIL
jgi:hypothetical protein